MKNTATVLVLMIMIASCRKQDNPDCSAEQITTSYYASKVIKDSFLLNGSDTIPYYPTEEGENLLFEYIYASAQCASIMDDEYTLTLNFMVNPGKDEFNYTDNEIKLTRAFVHQSGAWVNSFALPVLNGNINGKRLNAGMWIVHVDVMVKYLGVSLNKQIKFDRFYFRK
jgi:hypothetical protein